jgi:hypothetical protein
MYDYRLCSKFPCLICICLRGIKALEWHGASLGAGHVIRVLFYFQEYKQETIILSLV